MDDDTVVMVLGVNTGTFYTTVIKEDHSNFPVTSMYLKI